MKPLSIGLALVLIAMTFPLASSAQSSAGVQSAIRILTNKSRSPEERINAANDLAVLGQNSMDAAQALIGAMSNDLVPGVRAAAAHAMEFSAPLCEPCVQAVIGVLSQDTSIQVRLAAVQALMTLGVDSAVAIAALQNAAQNDPSLEVRKSAQTVYNCLSNNS